MDRQTAKFIAMVAENLPLIRPEVMQRWIENKDPAVLQEMLCRALWRPRVLKTVNLSVVPKSVSVVPKSVEEVRAIFSLKGYSISKTADDLMLNYVAFGATNKENELDLMITSVGELGFRASHKHCVSRLDIYQRAQDWFGLKLCPAKVALCNCVQWKCDDQSFSEKPIRFAMEPIVDSSGRARIFSYHQTYDNVLNNRKLVLETAFGHNLPVWDKDDCFAFVLPRK